MKDKGLILVIAVALLALVAGLIIGPSEYETRTTAEYRQMVREGK